MFFCFKLLNPMFFAIYTLCFVLVGCFFLFRITSIVCSLFAANILLAFWTANTLLAHVQCFVHQYSQVLCRASHNHFISQALIILGLPQTRGRKQLAWLNTERLNRKWILEMQVQWGSLNKVFGNNIKSFSSKAFTEKSQN